MISCVLRKPVDHSPLQNGTFLVSDGVEIRSVHLLVSVDMCKESAVAVDLKPDSDTGDAFPGADVVDCFWVLWLSIGIGYGRLSESECTALAFSDSSKSLLGDVFSHDRDDLPRTFGEVAAGYIRAY